MKTRVKTTLGLLASLASLAALALIALGISLSPASAQEDMVKLQPEALQPATRPAAKFKHDEHNAKAKLEDQCIACHHSGAKGVLVADETSEGTACSECHSVAGDKHQTPLRRAYHRQCINCHKARGTGPTHCSGCHDKRAH